MDVRQPDGQYQPATVHKLTDQSTYTVGESLECVKRMCGGCLWGVLVWSVYRKTEAHCKLEKRMTGCLTTVTV